MATRVRLSVGSARWHREVERSPLHPFGPVQRLTDKLVSVLVRLTLVELGQESAVIRDHLRRFLQIRNQPSPDAWRGGDALSPVLVTVTRNPVATGLATDLYAHLVGNDADFSNAPIDPIFGNSAGVGRRPSRR